MKTAVVTGANTGIGKEIARDLSRENFRVIMAVRDHDRGEAARREIVEDTKNEHVELAQIDLSNQKSIRDGARVLRDRLDRLDVLVNNAGVWLDEKKKSADGIELTWATNVLGYFLFTSELLDLLKKSAPSRVVNVASDLAHSLDLDDVQFDTRKFDGVAAYAQSKQADRMLSRAFAKRLAGTGVTVNAMHPGMVSTDLVRGGSLKSVVAKPVFALFGRSPKRGADTASWLATSRELEKTSGRYFVDRREKRDRFDDEAQIEALWSLCERMTSASRG